MNHDLQTYLKETLPVRSCILQEMEEFAATNRVPIMDLASIEFLLQLLRIHQPNSILEVGTAIGYSACRMASTLPEAKIVTMEKDLNMVELASSNIEKLGLSNQITLKQGDALDSMEKMCNEKTKFDFIFIDAAKGQYKRFFQFADQLIHPGGLIICDNVLFRGFVVDPDSAKNPRHKKLALKLRDFNQKLSEDKTYDTSIIPIGDGISISLRR